MSCSSTNRGIAVEVSLISSNLPVAVAISGSGTTRTVTFDVVGVDGFYLLRYWLIDTATTPNDPTTNPPTGESRVEWEDVTDSDGTLTKTIEHANAGSWYMAAVLVGRVGISDEIDFT